MMLGRRSFPIGAQRLLKINPPYEREVRIESRIPGYESNPKIHRHLPNNLMVFGEWDVNLGYEPEIFTMKNDYHFTSGSLFHDRLVKNKPLLNTRCFFASFFKS